MVRQQGPIFLMPLELAFSEKSLRQLCENETIAKRKLGARVAEKLKRRLADLRAASCVMDLVVGVPRELEGDNANQFAISLCDGYRMVFCANHTAVPFLESGAIDWARVSRVKVLRIEGNHD